MKVLFPLKNTFEIMPCSNLSEVLPVEINPSLNTRCMVLGVDFYGQIIKKLEFSHFFTL